MASGMRARTLGLVRCKLCSDFQCRSEWPNKAMRSHVKVKQAGSSTTMLTKAVRLVWSLRFLTKP